MVPTILIMGPFLIAFVLCVIQYMIIDPARRLLNIRFALMAGATVCVIGYPIVRDFDPDDRHLSWCFLALSLFWLAWSCRLFRRMPPREKY